MNGNEIKDHGKKLLKNKSFSYLKNLGIAWAAASAGGKAADSLMDIITKNAIAQSAAPIIGSGFGSFVVFPILHALDNRDVYHKDGKFDMKYFVKDHYKYSKGVAIINTAYFVGGYFLMRHLKMHPDTFPLSPNVVNSALLLAKYSLIYTYARYTGFIRNGNGDTPKDKKRDPVMAERMLKQ